jgi:hypothetical protein
MTKSEAEFLLGILRNRTRTTPADVLRALTRFLIEYGQSEANVPEYYYDDVHIIGAHDEGLTTYDIRKEGIYIALLPKAIELIEVMNEVETEYSGT